MTEEQFTAQLASLSTDQLDKVIVRLRELVAEKAEAKKKASRFPPSSTNDLNALADMQGLDLSGLMRDIKRR